MAIDELSLLLECSFRGISFPVKTVEFDATQSVVQHRRMDRDGARLENTGLGPISYNLVVPFCNTLARGPNETWNNLYPDTRNRMLAALSDRSTGDFIHPELGNRRCKASTFKETLDPDYRNGVVMTFTLIEDSEDNDATLITENAVNTASENAISLDAILGTLNPPIDTGLAELGFKDFLAAINAITAIFDQIQLVQTLTIGTIDAVIGKLNQLSDKVSDPVLTFGTLPDQIIASLLKLKQSSLVENQSIGYYSTKDKTTLGTLSIILQNTTSDLIGLNPQLARQPVIPIFTIVRYFK